MYVEKETDGSGGLEDGGFKPSNSTAFIRYPGPRMYRYHHLPHRSGPLALNGNIRRPEVESLLHEQYRPVETFTEATVVR